MDVIRWGRAAGKTTRMVELVKKHGGVLLCATVAEANRVRKQFGLNNQQVMFWKDAAMKTRGMSGVPGKSVYLDNADWILAQAVGVDVDCISVTGIGPGPDSHE